MRKSTAKAFPATTRGKLNRCLSCGTSKNIGKRRYCSVECRQKLRRRLNARTGLLKALNTRYAAFYFNGHVIIMDVLPYDSGEIFSFIFPRSPQQQPADDFCKMSNILGSAWWDERRKTNRKYLAARHVLSHANHNRKRTNSVHPFEYRKPTIRNRSLIYLKLGKSDLESAELQKVIKNAFRQQAKQHHPDMGGDNETFRRVFQAYEELISWAESPTFTVRRGFQDKWFYDGEKNKWVQPTPL